MIAFLTTCFYALLCAVCLWCAAHSRIRDRRDAVVAAGTLTAGCFLSNVAWVVNAVGSWVRIDAAAMLLFLFMLWRDRRLWKVQLAASAVAVMGVHAIFDPVDDGSFLKLYGYPATLNALLMAQLFIVGRIGSKGALDRGSGWLVSVRAWRSGHHSRGLRRRSDQ